MSILNDLVSQIENPALRERIAAEVDKLAKQKKFGLVFEEHLPECTPLWDIPVKRGSKVALKTGQVGDFYTVLKIGDGIATCLNKDKSATAEFAVDELVSVAEFGEPIYPYLKPLDTVCNAPESDLWHTLIEADNYHALQLLEYLYTGKVDCIYIDPPYNTGARDWKYNNDYVDGSDSYRHSKWLSFMQKRLKIAKRLLNPKDSVLIVTIDEKEYLHLGCLLEEMFPEADMQMISSVINPKGNRRDNQFSRCEEYIFFIYFGNAAIASNGSDMLRQSEKSETEEEDKSIRLRGLLRQASNHGKRTDRPNLFYPLLFEKESGKFLGHGPVLPITENRESYIPPEDAVAMWPIGSNGTELTWNLQPETLMSKHAQHFLSFGKWDGKQRTGYYLSAGQEENFKNGLYEVTGIDDDGAYIIRLKDASMKDVRPLTIWHRKEHSASEYGTAYLNSIIGSGRFSFPKSVYAVRDTIRFFVANKPNALIVDFFAGSGTTLHAVNLLNAEDGGHRRCIMVTNNEVSDAEAKALTERGYHPGDEEWNKLGIARYVTWPRTVCSIEGHDVNDQPLKGNYLGGDLPMADGFKANAAFFQLGFLDKTKVSLGKQFKELLSTLWMKAGAHGPCPSVEEGVPPMLILPENRMAILNDENRFGEFSECVAANPEIEVVYLVTDYESSFVAMTQVLEGKQTFQLYRDYLDNFRINAGRDSR
ncbi:MAG: site-specific DNA-methyltransferase [Oscillospiraceae bacterium]|nr:site-specific DNA-methyltransferase [Oscillospiraceae bacterium]